MLVQFTRQTKTIRARLFCKSKTPPNHVTVIAPYQPIYHHISVGIATGYGMDGRSSIPGSCKRLSLLNSVQTGSAAHPAFYPMDTGGSFPGG
jgi:hypothetical protein